MASITDLRQKRAALWEKTKKFLDNAKRERYFRTSGRDGKKTEFSG